jgi:hypothetical protein
LPVHGDELTVFLMIIDIRFVPLLLSLEYI